MDTIGIDRMSPIMPLQDPKPSLNEPYTPLLGGSCVFISGVISRVTILIIHISGLITPLITTHEPPSRD